MVLVTSRTRFTVCYDCQKDELKGEIKNEKIAVKKELAYPDRVEGIIKCINPKCITNTEPIPTKFSVSSEPLSATCYYCQTRMKGNEIANSII